MLLQTGVVSESFTAIWLLADELRLLSGRVPLMVAPQSGTMPKRFAAMRMLANEKPFGTEAWSSVFLSFFANVIGFHVHIQPEQMAECLLANETFELDGGWLDGG